MTLATKVLIAMSVGIIVGLGLNFSNLTENAWVDQNIINGVFHVGGKLFVNALKMLIVPLVLLSLIPGILGIGDIRLLGKIGSKAFLLYLATTAIAITTAITFAALSGIGTGLEIELKDAFTGREASKSFVEIIIGIIPSNIFAAMHNSETLSIIFLSVFFGIALLIEAKQSKELINLIEQLNRIIMRMINLIMAFAPYAVFCLVSKAIAERLNIKLFLQKIRNAQLFAFSTSSSAATIPITLRTTQQRLGVDGAVSSFTVPLGATINMDGTAMMQGVATVFIANLYGIDLSLSQYITVIITAVLASIGTAAVPGVGLVMLSLVFNQVGLPIEAIGYILGIDRVIDMTRTAVNVTGDTVVSTIVAKSENRLDISIFNDPEAGSIEETKINKEIPSNTDK